jgi:hypothetical protein
MKHFDRDASGTITLQGRVERLEALFQAMALGVLLGLVMIFLVGCDTVSKEEATVQDRGYTGTVPHTYEIDINLKDGRTLPCVWMPVDYGGLSCDWSKK